MALPPLRMPVPPVAVPPVPTSLARPMVVPPPGVQTPMPDPAMLQREELLKMMSPDGHDPNGDLPPGLTMPKPYNPPTFGAGRRSQ